MAYHAFCISVPDYRHANKGEPCENASKACEEGTFAAVALAVGCGVPPYSKARIGSRLAVEVACEDLRTFFREDTLTGSHGISIGRVPPHQNALLRPLTDAIAHHWSARVLADADAGLSPDGAPDPVIAPTEPRRGTTLMAAGVQDDHLALVQQGDGHAFVLFGDDGSLMPLFLDPLCQGHETAGMGDADVVDEFHSCLFDLGERPVAAVFLATDGLEDASAGSDLLDLRLFWYDMALSLTGDSFEAGSMYHAVDLYLKQLSERVSGDDISMAMLFDPKLLDACISKLGAQRNKVLALKEMRRSAATIRWLNRQDSVLFERLERAQLEERLMSARVQAGEPGSAVSRMDIERCRANVRLANSKYGQHHFLYLAYQEHYIELQDRLSAGEVCKDDAHDPA